YAHMVPAVESNGEDDFIPTGWRAWEGARTASSPAGDTQCLFRGAESACGSAKNRPPDSGLNLRQRQDTVLGESDERSRIDAHQQSDQGTEHGSAHERGSREGYRGGRRRILLVHVDDDPEVVVERDGAREDADHRHP